MAGGLLDQLIEQRLGHDGGVSGILGDSARTRAVRCVTPARFPKGRGIKRPAQRSLPRCRRILAINNEKENRMRTHACRMPLLAVAFIALGAPLSAGGAADSDPVGPVKPVVIVNTAAQPVPVQGTVSGSVSVVNTPSVTLVNTPTVDARQSGAWNVTLAGPAQVLLMLVLGRWDPRNETAPGASPGPFVRRDGVRS
jgi:hypothetical protein